SQASRSLELAPRAAFRGSAFLGCGSAAAPTVTLMSISVSRSVAGRAKSSALCGAVDTVGPRHGRRSARANARGKQKARHVGRALLVWNATERLEARHHAVETQQMGQRFKLSPLVVAEAHDQREPGRFES